MGVRVVFPDMGKDPSVQLIEKTITENGTYDAITDGANGYSKVNVNVEGGGGESDFSTAEVTINNSASDSYIDFSGIVIDNDTLVPMVSLSESASVLTVVLYKNIQHLTINADSITSISGNISGSMLDGFDVTGDCVINAVGYSDIG